MQKYTKYDIKLKSTFAEIYNKKLNLHNVTYHVAKHLYSVFDFTPLEDYVFVATALTKTELIDVYPSASGKRIAKYGLLRGDLDRDEQVNRAKGYNKKVVFRNEIADTDFPNILDHLIINHLEIFFKIYKKNSYEDAYAQNIVENFISLVCISFNLDTKQKKDLINSSCNVFFSDNASEDGNSVPEEAGILLGSIQAIPLDDLL